MTPSRIVTLVLVDQQRTVLGALPPFAVELPYWQEAADVVRGARSRHGVDVVLLRLLRAELPASPGGAVTYAAEVDARADAGLVGSLVPVDAATTALALGHDPRRAPYAEVGGPARSLDWAAGLLGGIAVAEQQRTWNLSSLWRLTAVDGRVGWLKQVPSFFAHEAVVLRWLAETVPDLGPPPLGVGDLGRQLLAEVPGDDLYDADEPTRVEIVHHAHRLQRASRDHCDGLVAAGVPDRRGGVLVDWIRARLVGRVGSHPAGRLLERLDRRVAELDACGLPETLVHGDAHGGNVRGAGDRMVFLDWGDSFVGNPVFDVITLTRSAPHAGQAGVLAAWSELWRRTVPGCEPERAASLAPVIAALRSAAVYAEFLDLIEPTEAPYHRADVPFWLDQAVALA